MKQLNSSSLTARLLWCSSRQIGQIERRAGVRFALPAGAGAYGLVLLDQTRGDEPEIQRAVERAILATREVQS
jgi:hypothetical protein